MQIDGQVALVTGGGSGLGAATARGLAGQGAKVAALDKNPPADGSGVFGVACDVTDEEAVEAAVATVADHFGQAPRIVVNCAGFWADGSRAAMWRRSAPQS